MDFPPEVERWRSLVSQYFQPQDVDKALWVIMYESGGNPSAYNGAGESSVGLFQMNQSGGLGSGYSLSQLQDPATNIRIARDAVYGGSGWQPWNENRVPRSDGQMWGSLGNHPYPGAGGSTQGAFGTYTATGRRVPTNASGQDQATVERLMSEPGDWESKAEIADWLVDSIMAERPKRSDYEDYADYAFDLNDWQGQLNDALANADALRAMAGGFYNGPNGEMIPWGDLPPEQRAALEQNNQLVFTKMMNDYKLTSYSLANDAQNTAFGQATDRLNSQLELDDLRLQKARDEVNRILGGLGESRSRADLITDTKRLAAPYATRPGKTAFTGRDLGAGVASFAAMAGISPDMNILQYPTEITLDPAGLLAQYDKELGVYGQPLPGVPDILTQPGDIPGVPSPVPIPQFGVPGAPNAGGGYGVPQPIPNATGSGQSILELGEEPDFTRPGGGLGEIFGY